MPTAGLNGHAFRPPQINPDEPDRAEMLRRIELALSMMAQALQMSGFSEYEAGEVNLSTRKAITDKVKERFGRR